MSAVQEVIRKPILRSPGDVRVKIVRYFCNDGSQAAPHALKDAQQERLLMLADNVFGSGTGHPELPQLTNLRREIARKVDGDSSGYGKDVKEFRSRVAELESAVEADLISTGIRLRPSSLVVQGALDKQFETLSDEIAG